MDTLLNFDPISSEQTAESHVNGVDGQNHSTAASSDPFGFDPFGDQFSSKTTTVTVTSNTSASQGFDDFDPFSNFTSTTHTTTTSGGGADPFAADSGAGGQRFDDQFAELMDGFDGRAGSGRPNGGYDDPYGESNGNVSRSHDGFEGHGEADYSDQDGEGEYANVQQERESYNESDHHEQHEEEGIYTNQSAIEDGIYEELDDKHSGGYRDMNYHEPQGAGGYHYDAEPVETGHDDAEEPNHSGYDQLQHAGGTASNRFEDEQDGYEREIPHSQVTKSSGNVTQIRVISQIPGNRGSESYASQHEVRSSRQFDDSNNSDSDDRVASVSPATERSSAPSYQQQQQDNKGAAIYFAENADDNSCVKCGKRVYEMEKITADLLVYHKTCFRCQKCNRILSLGNYASLNGQMYCKPHFIELFKTKGNYNDSFNQPCEPSRVVASENRRDETNDHTDSSRSAIRYSDNEDAEDDSLPKGMRKEEIPTVAIKSVRSMFEKMAVDSGDGVGAHQPAPMSRGGTPAVVGGRVNSRSSADVTPDVGARVSPAFDSAERAPATDVVQSSSTSIVEEELPPRAMARNLAARFQQMERESASQSSPTPVVSSRPAGGHSAKVVVGGYVPPAVSTTPAAEKSTKTSLTATAPRSSSTRTPPSGDQTSPAMESEVRHASASRKDSNTSSASGEKTSAPEEELPQQGMARSLVQHWRALEAASVELKETQSSPGQARGRSAGRSKFDGRRSQSMSRAETTQRAREYKGEPTVYNVMISKEVETADTVESELPVPQTTRNRLAMFQELQAESQASAKYQSTPKREETPSKARTFKWEVKDCIPASRRGIVVGGDAAKLRTTQAQASRPSSESSNSTRDRSTSEADYSGYSAVADEPDGHDVSAGSHSEIKEEELPAPATTRNLLQHFKSMEDVTKAPPTPQQSSNQRKAGGNVGGTGGNVGGSNRRVVDDEEDGVRESGLVRESDNYVEEELPAEGTTRSLMARFQTARHN